MTIDQVIAALEATKQHFQSHQKISRIENEITKGGYFRVGDVAIEIVEVRELKG